MQAPENRAKGVYMVNMNGKTDLVKKTSSDGKTNCFMVCVISNCVRIWKNGCDFIVYQISDSLISNDIIMH